LIKFDYLCAAGNAPSATDDERDEGKETGESGAKLFASSHILGLGIAGAFVLF